MNMLMLALLLVQQPTKGFSQAGAVEHIDLGHPISGSDYLLVAEALRHPEMRNVDLSCHSIYVYGRGDGRHVAFTSAKPRTIERKTRKGIEIIFVPLIRTTGRSASSWERTGESSG